MNEILKNATQSSDPDPLDLIDFMITAGDNLYPRIDTEPTD